MGALELALRKLRERLAAEGLFDADAQAAAAAFPRRIALVTSPTGAAIRDFLEVLRRRWRGVHVLVVPVRVQGDGAAEEIAAGIELVNRLAEPSRLLVVGRGGGSLEDLWASTKRSWSARFTPRGFRSSRPWATRSTSRCRTWWPTFAR